MDIDMIYGQLISERLREIPLRELLLELESTRPIFTTSTIQEVSSRFEAEHFETLPVVEDKTHRIVGVVHHINVLRELIKTNLKVPISETRVVRVAAKWW
jgi:CBS domain containing-hemolysin-like protein